MGNNEIISKINQSSEAVIIDANKISLNGKTINLTGDNVKISSTNFNVDKDGNMTCNNANVTGGNIELSSSSSNLPRIKIYSSNNINDYSTVSPIGFSTNYNGTKLIFLTRAKNSGENDWYGQIFLKKENSNAYVSLDQEALKFVNNESVIKTYIKETEIHTQDLYSKNLIVTGSKNRAVKINNGKYVLLNAYQTTNQKSER